MSFLQIEEKEGWYLIRPNQLDESQMDDLQVAVEKLEMGDRRHLVLSLREVDTIFSLHLTCFIQIYKFLRGIRCGFYLVDLAGSVRSVMEMTQLDTLVPLSDTYEEFLSSASDLPEVRPVTDADFSVERERGDGVAVIRLHGWCFHESLATLRAATAGLNEVVLLLGDLQYMETSVLVEMAQFGVQFRLRKLRQSIAEVAREKVLEERLIIEH